MPRVIDIFRVDSEFSALFQMMEVFYQARRGGKSYKLSTDFLRQIFSHGSDSDVVQVPGNAIWSET